MSIIVLKTSSNDMTVAESATKIKELIDLSLRENELFIKVTLINRIKPSKRSICFVLIEDIKLFCDEFTEGE